MKKIQYKRIIRVFVFTLVIFSFFIINNVKAENEVKDNTKCEIHVDPKDGSLYSDECLIGPKDESWKECMNAFGAAKYDVLSNDEVVKLFGFVIEEGNDGQYVLKMRPKSMDDDLINELENFEFKVLRINNTYDSKVNSAVGKTVSPDEDLTFSADLVDPSTLKNHYGNPIPDSSLDTFVVVLQNVTVISDKIGGSIFKGDSSSGLELVKCKGVVRVSITYSAGGGAKIFTSNIEDEGKDDPNAKQKAKIRDLLSNLPSGAVTQEIDCDKVLKACPYSDLEKCLDIHDVNDKEAIVTNTRDRMALNYCIIKAKAEETPTHVYQFTKEKKDFATAYKNKTIGGLCAKDKFVVPGENINDDKSYVFSNNTYTVTNDKSYKFLNKDYYFGNGFDDSVPLEGGSSYEYTYSGGDKDTVSLTCNLNCDEAIVVEYGPPQAATAGLCIEYQVRVTSIVSCESSFDGTPPSPKEVCYPAPNCQGHHGDTEVLDQGGPNLMFDSCIKSCDGGKYTSKCSKKCYNQVYGKSKSLKKSNNSTSSSTATKVADATHCVDYGDSYGGYYYRNSNGAIGFRGEYANWYRTHVTSRGGYVYTFSDFTTSNCWTSAHDGFPRVTSECNILYSGPCDDTCWFSGCSNKQYLNNCDALNEYQKNLEVYKAAVSSCKKAATCSTSTTEFTMKVTNGEGSDKTEIVFPYSSGKTNTKTLLTSDDKKLDNESSKVFKYNKEILLRFGGCYYNSAVKNWYHAWWSFPGTWVHKKSKEISYSKPVDYQNWDEVSNKFCIPYNFRDENQEWYYYSLAKAYNNPAIREKTKTVASYYNDKGEYCTETTDWEKYNTPEAPSVRYNIEATAGKDHGFGYFKWKVKVGCFYAYSNKIPTSSSKDKKTTCEPKTSENNYRIRSVDLKDLFPDTSGYKVGTTDQFGRKPGFNWSNLSTEQKIEDYTSFPDTYAKKVQALNTKVYSDEYLDYQIVLTPDSLKKIRDTLRSNANARYNSFNGDFIDINGVNHYVSKLFRGSGVAVNKNNKIPSGLTKGNANNASSPLRCNNMVKYNNSNCYVCDSSDCK